MFIPIMEDKYGSLLHSPNTTLNLRIKMLLITLLGQYDATHIPLQFYYHYLLFVRFLLITTICGSQINFENVLYFCNPVVQTNKINKKINNRLY